MADATSILKGRAASRTPRRPGACFAALGQLTRERPSADIPAMVGHLLRLALKPIGLCVLIGAAGATSEIVRDVRRGRRQKDHQRGV